MGFWEMWDTVATAESSGWVLSSTMILRLVERVDEWAHEHIEPGLLFRLTFGPICDLRERMYRR